MRRAFGIPNGMQIPDSRRSLFDRVAVPVLGVLLFALASPAEQPLPQVERLKSSLVLQHLKPNPMSSPPRTPAEQTVAQMYLPGGIPRGVGGGGAGSASAGRLRLGRARAHLGGGGLQLSDTSARRARASTRSSSSRTATATDVSRRARSSPKD